MSRQEAIFQYKDALKQGQKYYKNALNRGQHPFPPVLDDILDESTVAGRVSLGLVNVPSDLIVGVKSAGRVTALAGNFMPILEEHSEFAAKWISLCEAHLSDEGIRDPIVCTEYMGRFYVQEGNKRASVLKSYGAPRIPAMVTRLIPEYSSDRAVQVYYEFMDFYQKSGLYSMRFSRRGQYEKLQALLGFEPDQVWTEAQRRSFSAALSHFEAAYKKVKAGQQGAVSLSEAMLEMLEVFSLEEIKAQSVAELAQKLTSLWADAIIESEDRAPQLHTEPGSDGQNIVKKIFGLGRIEYAKIAFIYAFDPDKSAWTRAHDLGRLYLEQHMEGRCRVRVYEAYDKDYYAAMQKAVAEGAGLIFATTSPMMDACRRIATEHRNVRVFNCALHRHFSNVHMYYSRIHEAKFITGAIAGAMSEGDTVGYVANYPIYGVPASINAFALGLRMTNPKAKLKLLWSCMPGYPLLEFVKEGVDVISNRDATDPKEPHLAYEWGTYKLHADGSLQPLALPYWDWGRFYERIVKNYMDGTLAQGSAQGGINYFWGLSSGVIDVKLDEELPAGVRALAEILKNGLISGEIKPFRSRIYDQNGLMRCDGEREMSAEEIMGMDWFCDNVEGKLPKLEELLPQSVEMAKILGIGTERRETENEDTAAGG
ncbi:MAG: BMP family ABC transporter substrate-binding protein [Oscillospiraceae bacterium]|nr:BMP family ABC transporter substrate-binding protein [Oscillospiraceae bacterium]